MSSEDEMELSSSSGASSGSDLSSEEMSSGDDFDDDEDMMEDGEVDADDLNYLTESGDREVIPNGVKANEAYHIWNPDSLRARMESDITQTQQLLCVSHDLTKQLLQRYHFDVERLRSDFFADREKTLLSVGVGGECAVRDADDEEAECFICYDDVPWASAYALECGHTLCHSCWADYLRTQLPRGENAVMTTCPWKGCQRVVPEMAWVNFCDASKLELFERFTLMAYARGIFQSHFKVCPMPECECYVNFHSAANIPVECLCKERFCYACHDPEIGDHSPCSCKDAKAWIKKNSDESENVTWIRAKTKPCPKCNKPIEKNGGCMHMTCRANAGGCGHEFCWICFGNWRQHRACQKADPQVQKAEALQKNAENDLQRYMQFEHRFTAHKHAADVAKRDKLNMMGMEVTMIEYFDIQSSDLQFLKPCLSTLQSGRLMLAWSYVRTYYADEKRISLAEKNMYDYGVEQLEIHTDRLQERYEAGQNINVGDVASFLEWKQEVTNLTRVAQQFFDGFVNSVIKGSLISQSGEDMTEQERYYAAELEQLATMGFTNTGVLVPMLERAKGNLESVINQLVG